MQVTLDAFNWDLRELGGRTALEHFLWWKENDGTTGLPGVEGIGCRELGWHSDSAIEYFAAAEALLAVLPRLASPQREHLEQGLLKVIAENPLDEFGTGAESDGCYWISASPDSTASILRHSENADIDQLIELCKKTGADPERMIRQHLAVLRAAVSHGFGLLGHCG